MMVVLRMFWESLVRWFRNPYSSVVVSGLLIIPLLYGGTLVWAFWDPIGRAPAVPAAIVNLDTPVQADGQTIDGGTQIVSTLTQQAQLDWSVVSEQEAAEGLQAKRYYLYLTIPEDFSATLATANTSSPKQATLTVTSDDAINYLVGVLGEEAIGAAQGQGNQTVQDQVLRQLYEQLGIAEDKGRSRIDDIDRIRRGTDEAASASTELVAATDDAKAVTADLAAAVARADTVVNRVGEEILDHRSALRAVSADLDQYATTVTEVEDRLLAAERAAATASGPLQQEISATLTRIADDLTTPLDDLRALNSQLEALIADAQPQVDRAASVIAGLAALADELRAGQDALDSGIDRFGADLDAFCTRQPSDACAALAVTYDDLVRTPAATMTRAIDDADALLDEASAVATTLPGLLRDLDAGLSDLSALLADAETQIAVVEADLVALDAQVSEQLPAVATELEAATVTIGTDLSGLLSEASDRAAALGAAGSPLVTAVDDVERVADRTGRLADDTARGVSSLDASARDLSKAVVDLAPTVDSVTRVLERDLKDPPGILGASRKDFATVLSSPIVVDQNVLNEVPKFGDGFAPYFVPLALWVGGLVGLLFFVPLNLTARLSRAANWQVALGSYLPLAALGIVQSVVLWAVLTQVIGLQAASPWWLFATLVLSSLAFIAIIHALKSAFGLVGDFIAIALLVVQVTGDEGAYPIATFPDFLQWVHPYLPMTYSVDAVRRASASTDIQPYVSQDLLVLIGCIVAGVAATTIVARYRRAVSTDELRPLVTLN